MKRGLENLVSSAIKVLAPVVASVALAGYVSGCGSSDDRDPFPPYEDDRQEQICSPSRRNCEYNDVMRCRDDGTGWDYMRTCDYRCSNGECVDDPGTGNGTTPGNGEDNGTTPGNGGDDGNDEDCPGTFTDPRDGRSYNAVQIGNQCWMAENLNYAGVDSRCFFGDSRKCDAYGRLYQWDTATNACPPGWRFSERSDWHTLIFYLGGSSIAGGKMKATSHWNPPNTGATNESGFTALPGSAMDPDKKIGFPIGNVAIFWSKSYDGSPYQYGLQNSHEKVENNFSGGDWWHSVRCIKE